MKRSILFSLLIVSTLFAVPLDQALGQSPGRSGRGDSDRGGQRGNPFQGGGQFQRSAPSQPRSAPVQRANPIQRAAPIQRSAPSASSSSPIPRANPMPRPNSIQVAPRSNPIQSNPIQSNPIQRSGTSPRVTPTQAPSQLAAQIQGSNLLQRGGGGASPIQRANPIQRAAPMQQANPIQRGNFGGGNMGGINPGGISRPVSPSFGGLGAGARNPMPGNLGGNQARPSTSSPQAPQSTFRPSIGSTGPATGPSATNRPAISNPTARPQTPPITSRPAIGSGGTGSAPQTRPAPGGNRPSIATPSIDRPSLTRPASSEQPITRPTQRPSLGGLDQPSLTRPTARPTSPTSPDAPAPRPSLTRPDISRPDSTRPSISRPDVSRPDITRPEGGRPSIARPDGSRPSINRPDLTRPDGARPDITRPDNTRPDVTRPDVTRPDVTRPGGTRPSVTRPSLPQTDGERPDGARPGLTRPSVTRPSVTLPSTPDGLRPDGSRPGLTRPGIDRPGTERPNIDRPSIDRPGIERPDRPSVNRPGTTRPSVTLPGRPDRPDISINRPSVTRPPVTRPNLPETRPGRPNRPGVPNITLPQTGGRPSIVGPVYPTARPRPPINNNIINNNTVNNINNNFFFGNSGWGWGWGQPRWGWGGGWGTGIGWGTGVGWGINVGFNPWVSFWQTQFVPVHYHSWYHGTWARPWGTAIYAPMLLGYNTWGVRNPVYFWGNDVVYVNPYFGNVPGAFASVHDYSAPLVINNFVTQPNAQLGEGEIIQQDVAPPPEALSLFDQSLELFRKGDYRGSLEKIDQAIMANKNDAVLHEVRALNLFALGEYNAAAAVLNSLLAVAPGMDWTSMSRLYGSIDTYTSQLRRLESYAVQNPKDPASHFVLAYHYLVAGHDEMAASALRTVVRENPRDLVAARILTALDESLNPEPEANEIATAPTPAIPSEEIAANKLPTPRPNEPTSGNAQTSQTRPEATPEMNEPIDLDLFEDLRNPSETESDPADVGELIELDLVGVWQATSGPTTIILTIDEEGGFQWNAETKDQPKVELSGTLGGEEDMLVLESVSQGAMAGQVAPKDADHFEFYLAGAPADAPPLSFERQSQKQSF